MKVNPDCRYERFKFSYADSIQEAYEKECRNYHDFGGEEGYLQMKSIQPSLNIIRDFAQFVGNIRLKTGKNKYRTKSAKTAKAPQNKIRPNSYSKLFKSFR